MWMARRTLTREYMDDHEPPQRIVDEVHGFLGAINRWLGGTRATLARFERLSRRWAPGARIDVLDVACGGGDIARALVGWGRARGFDLRVTALDRSRRALDAAGRRGPAGGRLRFVEGDARALPVRPDGVDYVVCTLFLHHLTDDDVVERLEVWARLARRGLVVNDLIRRRRLWVWAWLLTRPFNRVLRNDGPLSVRRAYRPAELTSLIRRAGLSWLTVNTHLGHRLTIAGDRPDASDGPGR